MSKIKVVAAVCLMLCCNTILAENTDSFSLTIKVSGAIPNTGDAIFSLFTEDNYLSEPVVNKTIPIDASGAAQLVIENLLPGTYAVSVIHDKNRDGKLNTGFLRIPTEKIGMSNNAKGRFGPPSFAKASFVLSESTAIEIVLSNAKK